MAAACPAATRLAVDDPWEWQDGVVRSGPPPREWVLRWQAMQRDLRLAAARLLTARHALYTARARSVAAAGHEEIARRSAIGAWWELVRPGIPGPAARRPLEARRDVAGARVVLARGALRKAAEEAEAAAAAALEAAQELEMVQARIAGVREPEELGDTAPEEHAGAAGRPPAQAAIGEADVGAAEPTGGASESRQAAAGEAAEDSEEQAGSVAEGREAFYAEALGDEIWRIRHDLISAMTRYYNSDTALGAAVRTWMSEHEEEFNRPRRSASRHAPYEHRAPAPRGRHDRPRGRRWPPGRSWGRGSADVTAPSP